MAEAKLTVSGLAGRYATALFELANQSQVLDKVAKNLSDFGAAARGNADLAALMTSPKIDRSAAAKAVTAVASTLGLEPLTAKFLGTLAQNRRLSAFADIQSAFAQLLSAHKGETSATVTSAHPLTEAQMSALKAKLKTGLGRDVAIETRIDPSILGGLVVKVGSKLIDSSLKTKLDSLTLAMKTAQG